MKAKKKKRGAGILLLLILILGALLLLRLLSARKEPAAATPAPTANPEPTAMTESTPAPLSAETASPTPEPTPVPTPYPSPAGYTEQTYNLVSDMVFAYANKQEAAAGIIEDDLARLEQADPALGALWRKIMALWSETNTGLTLHDRVLPDGLPEDESLCIVVLGFQLQADGTMAPELEGRCTAALACAEKYPEAYIAVTGGGTAWQNPGATEAGVMADWLIAHGVAPERIIREDRSMTTGDNAAFTCKLLREQYPQVQSLAIVTSDYHLPLGVLLFQEEAYLTEYRTGSLPYRVISNAVYDTGGAVMADSPMAQRLWLWSLADPGY